MVGGLDSHEFITSYLCKDLNAVVISVDYRLAPEHRFPAAFEDCLAVYHWLKQHGSAWQIDSENIVLAGDSAGGNLATLLQWSYNIVVCKLKGWHWFIHV